jgi:phospholipid-translocating ATPase
MSEQIEKDLVLLGATAIEDRLQDGVPECIATLKRAGIKIWVLTGDKLETAISIGFATCLLNHDMNLIVIREGRKGSGGIGVYEQLRKAAEFFSNDPEIQKSLREMQAPAPAESNGTPRPSMSNLRSMSIGADSILSMPTTSRPGGYALVIDGVALKHALEKWRPLLLSLACKCKGVICCRVSPLQKAEVVKLVKHGRDALTCAIGDGANDVSMIQVILSEYILYENHMTQYSRLTFNFPYF